MEPTLCDFGASTYLIFSDNVPHFIYYTHVTALIFSLIVGFFVFLKDRKSLVNKILFWSLVPFLLWVFFNIIIWASNRSDVIMFLWSLQIMIEPITYIGMLYLIYVFINKKDVSFKIKITALLIYLPLIIITPTSYSLSGFNLSLCIPDENYYSYYTYILELSSVILIAIYSYIKYRKENDIDFKKQILYLSFGTILFLLSFASGNIFGSFTDDWVNSQFGLFGTPVFAAFIAYLVIRYKTFNIKLISVQVLVGVLWIALLAVLFVTTIENVRIIVSLTLILFFVVGILLVKSVLKEVKQREQIEKLAQELEIKNKKLEELDEFKNQYIVDARHDLRGPITAIVGFADLIINGTFGKIPKAVAENTKKIEGAANEMKAKMESFLDETQFRLGAVPLKLESNISLHSLLGELVNELKIRVDQKSLYLKLEPSVKDVIITADRIKLKSAIYNIIENAIKYTEHGGVTVKFEGDNKLAKIIVSDTGIGIPADKLKVIFEQKFQRTEEAKKMAEGKGIGLFGAGKTIQYHQGRAWAESEGLGKGSTFYIELPINI